MCSDFEILLKQRGRQNQAFADVIEAIELRVGRKTRGGGECDSEDVSYRVLVFQLVQPPQNRSTGTRFLEFFDEPANG